jgi:ATP-dependent RNA helicase RhlE
MTFEKLNLIAPLSSALKNKGYVTPTPIQIQAIPHLLDGKDVFGCAQTGTGKTAAFALPILQMLNGKPHSGIKALILAPTRELAIQIDESFRDYGKQLHVRHTVIYGGVSQLRQTEILRKGVDVLIATPGRLLDLMQQGFIKLNTIEFFVLDEVDRMLDMGFINDIKKIIAKLPAKKQTLFFSATVPPEIKKLADSLLHNPVMVSVAPISAPAEMVKQSVYHVEKNDKRALLQHLLTELDIDHALVFTRTKHGADRVVKDLIRIGISARAIHGNKSQNARQEALKGFKDRSVKILVATDIASRGIDVDKLTHVINFELPEVPETYVHRIGRTGRAGESGVAISFCGSEERPYLNGINKLLKKNIEVVHLHPGSIPGVTLKQVTHVPTAAPSSQVKKRSFNGQQNRRRKVA